MNTISNLNKDNFLLRQNKHKWFRSDFWLYFAFTKPVILGIKFMTESNRQFFKLESDSRYLSLFLIIFMNENDFSHL